MKSSGQTDTLDRALVVKTSTDAEPYHFVGSGLRNVYLVGVEYEIDAATERAVSCNSVPAEPDGGDWEGVGGEEVSAERG